MLTYATDQLWGEIAYVAFHLHWSLDTILDLEHPTRIRLLAELDVLAGRGGGTAWGSV
ncbi:DUF6760 family protein [Actinocatenispora thailandica]|uniref:DUF6760 family protein n=1 Tax=Actinocatenispora thailandica TaxID=227318 RepID=UPI003B834EA0